MTLSNVLPFVAEHLGQATLFALAILALALLLRRAPARARYNLYLLASAKLVVPSALVVAGLSLVDARIPALLPPALAAVFDPGRLLALALDGLGLGSGSAATGSGSPMGSPLPITLLLLGAWAAGSAVLLVGWVRRLRAFSASLGAGRRLEAEPPALLLQELRFRLGLRQPVGLLESAQVIEPGVWGLRHPVVVLPAGMASHLSPAELEVVLLHELVHVQRRDNLVAHLHMLVCSLFWFHPLVWWLDRKLLAEREKACDDRVLEISGASEVYASSLVKVLRLGLGWPLAGVSGALGSNLRRRLDYIRTGRPDGVSLLHRGVLAAACGLLLVTSLSLGSPAGASGRQPVRALTAAELVRGVESDVVGACRIPDEPPRPHACPRKGRAGSGGGQGTPRRAAS